MKIIFVSRLHVDAGLTRASEIDDLETNPISIIVEGEFGLG